MEFNEQRKITFYSWPGFAGSFEIGVGMLFEHSRGNYAERKYDINISYGKLLYRWFREQTSSI